MNTAICEICKHIAVVPKLDSTVHQITHFPAHILGTSKTDNDLLVSMR